MKRLHMLRDSLAGRGIDGILITNIRNVRYLSQFSGSSACILITRKEKIFATDPRYEEQTRREVRGFDVLIEREERPREILDRAKAAGVKVLGFESTVTYAFYRSLLRRGVRVRMVSNLIEDMRRVKERIELKRIRTALGRAEKAFLRVKRQVRAGVTERALALRLESYLKEEGCRRIPFDIIVASGRNAAMPHAQPSDNRVKAGDFVVFDWGGEADGYYADISRTLLMKGRGLSRKVEVYHTVLTANREAIRAVREGIPSTAVDKTARDVIKKAGYDAYFGHGTGHGVGLDVHELPRISRFGRETLRAGMVFTIEPGIYIPAIGGVRIEDMVAVEKQGCSVLTTLPKTLELV